MATTARDIMETDFDIVTPDTPLAELEREFIDKRAAIFPVMQQDKLVGVVSRSDVVRQLYVERSRAEMVYEAPPEAQPHATAEEASHIARQVGERLETLRTDDVMIHRVVSVPPDATAAEMASKMVANGIHELVVQEGSALVGVVTSLDLLGVFPG